MSAILPILAWLALVSSLALSPVIPELSNIVVVTVMVLTLPVLFWTLGSRQFSLGWQAWMLWVALALMMLALLPTTRSSANFVVIAVLAPLWLAPCLAAALKSLRHHLRPRNIAAVALVGCVIAAAIAIYDVYGRGLERGGELTMNVIHFGDLALVLGFLALAGFFDMRGWWRLIFLAGPFLALLAVFLSGSRGPIIAFVGLAVVAVGYLSLTSIPRTWRIPSILLSMCVLVLAVHGIATGWLMRFPRFDELGNFLASGQSADSSINLRLAMYEGAWQAFLASPIYGHGGEFFVSIAAELGGGGDAITPFDHLHSDIADFAAIGGLLGLASYALLLVTPVLLGASIRRHRAGTLYISLMIPAAYFAMGLTNATFGILVLTTLFGVVLAILIAEASLTDPE